MSIVNATRAINRTGKHALDAGVMRSRVRLARQTYVEQEAQVPNADVEFAAVDIQGHAVVVGVPVAASHIATVAMQTVHTHAIGHQTSAPNHHRQKRRVRSTHHSSASSCSMVWMMSWNGRSGWGWQSGDGATTKWYAGSDDGTYAAPPTSNGLAGSCGGKPITGSLMSTVTSAAPAK